MPIYTYEACEPSKGCAQCRAGFDLLQSLRDEPVKVCPSCGAKVERVISAPNLGRSEAALDDRAKAAGFSKLKRIGSGEYERQY
ncbi:MAG: FmdB family zinc ribbon protein [Kiritimatiellia bacterium]